MRIEKINEGVCALFDDSGLHVGNFKWIQGQWKFKAMGYGPHNQLLPGGGPLTARHNITFAQLDETEIRTHFFGK